RLNERFATQSSESGHRERASKCLLRANSDQMQRSKNTRSPRRPTIRDFAERQLWNMRGFPASVRLDAGELHHLAPLLGFLCDQLAEVGGRTRKHRAAEVSEPRFHVGIGEASVDLLV